MLIVGAKGLAKEVLEILHQLNETNNLYFYDDVNKNVPDQLYKSFPILKNLNEAKNLFLNDSRFTIGVGNPLLRKNLYDKFKAIGGTFISTISPFANIGHYENIIGDGCNIMTGTVITNNITIGKGCLINPNCTIGHDSIIESFTALSPGVNIPGYCHIGSLCDIGTNATLLPNITLGNNVIVGAGAVVTKNFPDNVTLTGIPAKAKADNKNL